MLMKKIWVNYIFVSLLMLVGVFSFISLNKDTSFSKDGGFQTPISTQEEISIPKESEIIKKIEQPTVEPNIQEIEIVDDSVYETASWADFASTGFAGGDGSKENPYEISNAEDLAFMYNALRQNYAFYKNNFFELTADIILNDGYFEEDGTYHDGGDGLLYSWTPMMVAEGLVLNGQGYAIQGMYIDWESSSGAGLFGSSGFYIKEIMNLNIENAYLNANKHVYALGMYVEKISNKKTKKQIINTCNNKK